MSVEIAMKIGTIPHGRMRIKYARKLPEVGAIVLVKPAGKNRHKWRRVKIESYIDSWYCKASYV